jgi:multiple sugar transport system substrate-binding protein
MDRTAMRRGVALLVSAVLLAAACGTNQGGGAASAGSPGAAASPGAAGLSGELNVWAMGTEGEKLGMLADDFMKANPNVKIHVTPIGWGEAHNKLLTSIAGRQSPDVTQLGTTWNAEFAKTGALDEVPSNIDKTQFFEGAWNTASFNGKAYGVPWYVETRLLFYREDILEKAGVKPPTNWDELKAAAVAIKDKGAAKYGINLSAKNWQELIPFFWSNGGEIIGSDGKFQLNSQPMIDALTYYQSFFKDSLTPGSAPQGFAIEQGFVAGTHPMFFSGPWHLGLVEKMVADSGKDVKWNITELPSKQSSTSFVGGSNLAVFKTTKNRDAAWAFVNFLLQPTVQGKWYETVSDLPSVKNVWQEGKLKTDDKLQIFAKQLETAKGPPSVPNWERIAAVIDQEMEKVNAGKQTPQAAAEAMQKQAEAIGTGS